jgi:3-isopropylmalate dehydrogenase
MEKRIAVIPGDGIGPEVTAQSIKVLDAVADRFGHQFGYVYGLMGAVAIDATGVPLPVETLDTCLDSDAILFGAIGHPKYDNDPSAPVRPEQGLLQLRKALGLFTNIRPITTYPSLHHLSPLKERLLTDVDFVVYRELTGGIYFGKKERDEAYTEASDLCVYTRAEVERIAHLAFVAARARRKRLTLVDKANVLETSRLWRKVVQELGASYPDVEVDYLFVDNAAMQLVLNPRQFDVILTENMFGDILSDEASVLSGSLGLLPSASIGVHTSLFEPIHGSYPAAAGKDIANPVGSVLSAAMLLEHLGLAGEAAAVREAVNWAIDARYVTKDIEPINFYFTSTIGDLLADRVAGRESSAPNPANVDLRKSTLI